MLFMEEISYMHQKQGERKEFKGFISKYGMDLKHDVKEFNIQIHSSDIEIGT